MIDQLWQSFPRLLEQNIDGLLDHAVPNSGKTFRLYKTCQREELWSGSFEEFQKNLYDFFSLPRRYRRKSGFDLHLNRPMNREVYEGFHINFATADVSEQAVRHLVGWAHHLMRVGYKTTHAVISTAVLAKTVDRLIHPGPNDKAENFDFEDFCQSWKKVVFQFFGFSGESEVDKISRELRWLNAQILENEKFIRERSLASIILTQAEQEWVAVVRNAVEKGMEAPVFPWQKESEKIQLQNLEKVIRLYNLARQTTHAAILLKKEDIRVTVLSRCNELCPQS